MNKLYSSLLLSCLAVTVLAQYPAGNAFRIDYDQFVATNQLKHFNCGNDNMLNVSNELTLEIWVQMRDIGDNQKLIGKFDLMNTSYLLGVDQGSIYPEVWTPAHNEDLAGLMNPIAQHWHHLAMTFKAGDALKSYINGVEVGSVPVGAASITPNTNDLIIGIASWDPNHFQAFGNFDEVRIWNVARTEQEIQEAMHRELTGSETGLIAYYDFNQSTGSMLPDMTGNGNDGTGINVDADEWVSSKAVIANMATSMAQDLHGLWNGLSFTDPRVAVTDNGMTLSAMGLDTADYAVFGHDGGTGTTTADIAANAPMNFERATRVWDMTVIGPVNANVIMNLVNAAGGGTMLNDAAPTANYTLLYRPGSTGEFMPVAAGSSNISGVITFSGVTLVEGQYTVGVGDSEYLNISVSELNQAAQINVTPNPSNGRFNINSTGTDLDLTSIELFDICGNRIPVDPQQGTYNNVTLDLSGKATGIYLLNVVTEERSYTQRLVLK